MISFTNEIILSNDLAYAIFDRYPVNDGHILIISYRHVEDFWTSTPEERRTLNDLTEECKELLDTKLNRMVITWELTAGRQMDRVFFIYMFT